MRTRRMGSVAVAGVLLCAGARAQMTTRVSLDSAGAQGNGSAMGCSISADGRYVAFDSAATNLVAGDGNGHWDVFVRDRLSGTTERVSVDSSGLEGDGNSALTTASDSRCVSADGRFVAFYSLATNLVVGDTNGTGDVFVRDRQLGTTECVSVSSAGVQGNADSTGCTITPDGRFVAYCSLASNLVTGDTNGYEDVFVRDRQLGTTERVSISTAGLQADYFSAVPSISPDGRFVAFDSYASNLAVPDTNGQPDVFVRDRQLGTTEMVNLSTAGLQANNATYGPAISADGRFVSFVSYATNLIAGDTNTYPDVFVRDRQGSTTERVSIDSTGQQTYGLCDLASISLDGRFVIFYSYATSLVPGDTNGVPDVFVHDRLVGITERISVGAAGQQANAGSGDSSVSADGRYVAFVTGASDLVSGDTNGTADVFVRDRTAAGFTSMCEPGNSGVIACPCGNPAGGAGRGCDNSAATGGATLSASGIAYLSLDSLVLTTVGENPTATSILGQGDSLLSPGVPFGHGVRCAGGSLKRMFAKTAVSGSISVPDFVAGDLSISARSAQLGSLIQPGQTRYYYVYYRDPFLLGGCPATSAFNSTQTASISWWP